MTQRARLVHVPIDDLDPGRNVRVDLTGIDDLARSIARHGVLQPITIVPSADGTRAEVLFGHRRLAAARLAGLTEIPAFVRERGSERTRLLTQLAENFDRAALTYLDEAYAYRDLRRLGMTQTQIAEAVGRTPTMVSKILALLDYPDVVRQAVHRRTIGLHDALVIPVDLARRTDGRTLASVLRRGGRHVRTWVRQQCATTPTPIQGRKAYSTVNITDEYLEKVRAAAAERHETIAAWLHRAIDLALERQTAIRSGEPVS